MGSSGSGNFSDYSQNKSVGANQGGKSGKDECNKAYSIILEEVDRCEYYINHSSLPPNGLSIKIDFHLRLEAKDASSNEIIGYLPTKYNFLVNCIKNGFIFKGEIVSSITKPILIVRVDIAP
jgi:hypothetical protein